MKKVIAFAVVFLALVFATSTSALNIKQIQKNDVEQIEKVISGIHNNGYSKHEEEYLAVRLKVINKEGVNNAGRNIVLDGKENGNEASDTEVKKATEDLDLILNPPVPEVSTTTETSTEITTTTTETASGGYTIPSEIVECESGGDYSAVNPSSGAYGAYQIIPSTADAYGCDLSTPAGQDSCAAEIYADVGSSAWVC